MVNPYEEYVLALRRNPSMRSYVERHYLDADLSQAVDRYSKSEEFNHIVSVVKEFSPPSAKVLDIGVGRGLTSLAFRKSGIDVIGLEYDWSRISGIGALAEHLRSSGSRLDALRGDALYLPFDQGRFDVVFCRSVLHHLQSLEKGLAEIARVLRPDGTFIAWNEHIASVLSLKRRFLQSHPAVQYGVNENAYSIPHYWYVLRSAGFRDIHFSNHCLEFKEFCRRSGRGQLAYYLHRLRRSVFVDEAVLPVTCIVCRRSPVSVI